MYKKILLGVLFAIFTLTCAGVGTAKAAGLPAQTIATGVVFENNAATTNVSVSATCNNNIQTDVTDTRGSYSVSFTAPQCPFGSTVKVTATNGFYSGAASGTAQGFSPRVSLAAVNVTMNILPVTEVNGVITASSIPVAGAAVSATCNGNMQAATTNATGAYKVTFPIASSGSNGPGCPAGSRVKVTANKGNTSGLAFGIVQTVTDKLNTATVNVPIVIFGAVVFTGYPVDSLSKYDNPQSITTGPDGNLWFTMPRSGYIGKIMPNGGIIKYPTPFRVQPNGITSGPDGNVWFTETYDGKVCKITPVGSIKCFVAGGYPLGITIGPNGNLWFAIRGGIGEITTAGVFTEHPVVANFILNPVAVTTGSDGNLWFTSGSSNISKMTPEGVVTNYTSYSGAAIDGITTGTDGNVWYTEGFYGTNKVYKITPSGIITQYATPYGSIPEAITTGPDGNLWFTEASGQNIGRITLNGNVTEYSHPTSVSNLFNGLNQYGITTGPDGNLWFAGTGMVTKMNL